MGSRSGMCERASSSHSCTFSSRSLRTCDESLYPAARRLCTSSCRLYGTFWPAGQNAGSSSGSRNRRSNNNVRFQSHVQSYVQRMFGKTRGRQRTHTERFWLQRDILYTLEIWKDLCALLCTVGSASTFVARSPHRGGRPSPARLGRSLFAVWFFGSSGK